MPLTVDNWIAIGAAVVGALGGAFTTWLGIRLSTKRKIVAWTVFNEVDLLNKTLAGNLPVEIRIAGKRQTSVTMIRVRLGGAGNETIEKIAPSIRFPGAKLLHAAVVGDLKDYGKHVALKWKRGESICSVELSFLNPGQTIELEFLASDYDKAEADLAAPGVALKYENASGWESSVLNAAVSFTSIGFSLLGVGVRVSPAPSPMNEIARELTAIRTELSRIRTLPVTIQTETKALLQATARENDQVS